MGQFWNESASVCQVDASPLTLKQSSAATFIALVGVIGTGNTERKGSVLPPSLPRSDNAPNKFNRRHEHVLLRVRS